MRNIPVSVETRESDRASSADGRMGPWVKATDNLTGGIGTAGHAAGASGKEIIINEHESRDEQDEQLVRAENHYK